MQLVVHCVHELLRCRSMLQACGRDDHKGLKQHWQAYRAWECTMRGRQEAPAGSMVMCWSMRAAASPKGSQLGMCSSATSSSVNAHSLSACPSNQVLNSRVMLQSLTEKELLSNDLTGAGAAWLWQIQFSR